MEDNFLEVEERRLCQKYNCKDIKEVLEKERKILQELAENKKKFMRLKNS